jgi:hypothetical protein
MSNAFRLERRLTALVVSASCLAGCGGSATENGAATAGATSAGNGSTESAGSGGATIGSAGAGGASNGGTASGGIGGIRDSCEQTKDGYTALLASLLSQSSSESCVLNTDCEYIQTSDCGNDCSVSIANSTAGPAITSQLAAFAATNCAFCVFPELPCTTIAIPATRCVAGMCE